MSGESPDARSLRASRHRAHLSLTTSASGVADSTISYNTYATGVTEGSLCLSQFPPPPMTIPSSPTVDPYLPSPSRSTFTVTAPSRAYSGGQPSPVWSTFTAAAQASYASRSVTPIVRPGLVLDQDLPSPAHSSFTITSPPSACTSPLLPATNANRGYPDDGSSSRGRGRPGGGSQSPTSLLMAGKLSPYDWHEGSSIISLEPAEERMLSTSAITGLLSSNSPDKTPSPHDDSRRGVYPPSHTGANNPISETSYPPHSLRHNEPIYGENDTMASSSYGEHPNIVRTAHGRKISVVSTIPATLPYMASEGEPSESHHPRSQTTYGSTAPLNPLPPSAFSSAMDKMQSAYIQASIGTPQHLTPERPLSPNLSSGKASSKPQRRTSAHSSKSVKSHVSSLISAVGHRTARAARSTMGWMQIKPLPPIPTIPHTSIYQEQEHRRMEGAVPLPQLAERADRLAVMLDTGHLPHDDITRPSSRFYSDKDSPAYSDKYQSERRHSSRRSKSFFKRPISRSEKTKLYIGASVLALLVLVGIIVGVVVSHGHAHSPSCAANRTGNTCSLGEWCAPLVCKWIGLTSNVDSTCVCTSSSSQCNPLAQSLVTLIPIVNSNFGANFTPGTVADAMSSSRASGLSDDCAAQARVVDVSPALDSQTVPNRTEWAQGALLWSFVLSQNTSSVGQLRDFVSKAHWSSLPGDGPVTGLSSKFSTTQLGYVFDFAGQTVSAPNVSFVTDGQPSNAQLAEVDSTAHAALDRMYSFASGACFTEELAFDGSADPSVRTASSTLQTTAMINYWQNVLQQDPSKFLTFLSLLISSPILIPFDANGTAGETSISSLLTNSSTAPFPPPLACYPGLSKSQIQLITDLETSVFGLSSPAVQADFDVSCFPDRPIYGVLDILRLRLPFQDSQAGAKQAAILSRDASSRVVVYNGEVLSNLNYSNTTSIPTTDPRQFGTLHHMNHVLLDFFEAIPNTSVATQLVDYVLSYAVTPPSNDTLLGQSLDTIPTLEVAVFGSVTPPDVSSVVSSFTTPSGDLFFGTSQSLAVRDWAMVAAQSSVTWTEFADSPKVVDDNSFTDSGFNEVWDPAFTFFHSSSNAVVSVGNITAGFTAINKFTST